MPGQLPVGLFPENYRKDYQDLSSAGNLNYVSIDFKFFIKI